MSITSTSSVSEKDRKRREFILNGKPMAVVLSISLPLILLGAFSYLSSIIDTLVVAQSDNNALSSVVMISQIKNLFTALGSGFATGGSIIVARLIGRNEYEDAKRVANTLISIFFLRRDTDSGDFYAAGDEYSAHAGPYRKYGAQRRGIF